MTDRKLVGKFLLSRDEQTFREIYQRHTPALYMLALRLTGGTENEAQDAVQETWIRACGGFSDFRWNSKLRTWLSGILVNCVRETQKKFSKRSEKELTESDFSVSETSSGKNFDLEKIIENLPSGYRQVLVLHDIEGYTHEEIGLLLEINPGTSKSQLFHARRSVRASLQKNARHKK